MIVVQIRLFRFDVSEFEQHAYVVGTSQGGLSDVLDCIKVNEETCTFEVLRGSIELGGGVQAGMSGGRRSILFREILTECENCANPHGWHHKITRSSYRLGYIAEQVPTEREQRHISLEEELKTRVPELIPLDQEPALNLVKFLRKNARRDIHDSTVEVVVVPTSQVGPGCDKVCNGCHLCTEARSETSSKTTSYYQDGIVHEIAANQIDTACEL